MTKASTLLSFPKLTKQSTGEPRAPQKGNKMKITRLKRGYRIHMSDTEFELYIRAIDSGMADMGNYDDPYDSVQRYYNRINGTEKISSWYQIAEDRRNK